MFDPNPVKSDLNVENHGIAFSLAEKDFVWESAFETMDRRPYPEVRTLAIGFIGRRLHVLVFTRRGLRIRLISVRKANEREIRCYVEFRGRQVS